MRKISLIVLFLISLLSTNAHAQLVITDPDYDQSNPLNCGSINPVTLNFSDGAANYTPNMDEIFVLCPDLNQGTKVSIAFATNIGFTWDVHPTDTLYVYDGPSTSSPLIGAYNSGTDPTGFFVQASFANNPSGCLTLRFRSNGASEGTGWDAHVACDNPPQPFTPHIEAYINGVGPNALNPLDTGYVDICYGDSIMFVALPEFPYSFETIGYGYSQNVGNCSYQWTIGGVGQFNNDTIWFTPPQRLGYYVDLRVTDIFPQIKRTTCKVRVSQLPIFAGTGPVEDSVCLGQFTNLIGGVTPTDTVGINIPGGEFQIGGIFAGLTFLPDGSGAQYTTGIAISGFNDTTTFTDACDIDQLCLDIEHSYIGDIEITLTCPTGQTVSLMNAYNQTPFGWSELTPGGCGNGIGIALGNDTDIDGGAPGSPVWTYCFSQCAATTGTICDAALGTGVINNDYGVPSVDPTGVFLPDGDFNGFIGCPINGNWTITVQDNQGIDDGYIFQWGLYFNSSLYPNSEGYQNTVITDFWTNDPTIISGQSDTTIVIQPTTSGYSYYTYNVVDDFGCPYDTTVSLFVRSLPSIFSDTIVCDTVFQVAGTQAFSGGVWTSSSPAITFLPNASALNPAILPDNIGGAPYIISFTDNACDQTVSAEVVFPPYAQLYLPDTVVCVGAPYVIVPQTNGTTTDYNWNTGATSSSISVTQPGNYILTASNVCYSAIDTSSIGNMVCEINAPNVIVLSSQVGNNAFFVEYEGIQDFECTILNRWGNVIYQYFDASGSWDGTSNGKTVEEGTYFYIIKATFLSGEEVVKHGFVHVQL